MPGTQTSLRYYWGLGKQIGKGTPTAPATFPRWLDGSSIMPKLGATRVLEGDGSRDASFTLKNLQDWSAPLQCYPRPVEAGQLLAAAFGSGCDLIGGGGPTFTHNLTPAETPDFFSVEAGLLNADLLNRGADSVSEELVIEGSAGQPIKMSSTFRPLTGARQAVAAAVTVETGYPYLYSGGVFTVDAVTSAFVTKFKFTFKNGIDRPQTNAVTAEDNIWGRRTLDAEYSLLFQSDSFFRKMFYGNAGGTTDSQVVGQGSADLLFYPGGDVTSPYTMELVVPVIDYWGDAPLPNLAGKVFTYDVKGYVPRSGGSPLISAVVLNTKGIAY